MLFHNLILTYRNFKRYRSSFFINLIGLSTGLACTMFIYLWVNDELSVDKFHEKDARLFRVQEHQKYSDNIMTTWSTPGILAETLKDEVSEIEYAATTTWETKVTLTNGDKNIKATGFYAGEDFFNIFSYGLFDGDPNQVLKDKNSIVISEDLAIKLFGTIENVVGKSIKFQHDNSFLISGLFKGTPENASHFLEWIIPFEKFKEENDWVLEWGNNGPNTFVILNQGVDAEQLSTKIADFIKTKNPESHITLFLRKHSENYLYGRFRDGKQAGGRIEYVQLFSLIAIFILLIACINFMNLSTARASRRAKEVGIKKAVGAPKSSLISQYMTESLIMSVLSLLVAVIVVAVLLPQFNDITDKKIVMSFDPLVLLSYLLIALLTGVISGSYPAFYLSGFSTTQVLKGDIKGSIAELWARRGLVIFQFTLSIVLIVSVVVIYKQIDFVQNSNLGYDKDQLIYFEMEGKAEDQVETFLTEVKRIPGVTGASTIGHNLLSRNNNTMGMDWPGKTDENILFETVRVNYDMIELLGVEMVEGRTFSRDYGADTAKIIFNEEAIRIMRLEEDPLGQTVNLWGDDRQIIGVVKDFHFQSLHSTVKPLFFILSPNITWNCMIKLKAGQEKQTIEELTAFYQDFNPGFTFDFYFMDEQYQRRYAAEQRVSMLSRYFAGMAIIISCLGLFGLAAFTAERRQKEIGIRKVLGSSVTNIVYILSKDFTRLVLISIILSLPISYYLIKDWLDRFAFRIELEIWFFISAGLIALVIAWLTVGSQALRAAHINPAECLRDE